ncbi:MAG: DNA polymerase III subunit beta [Desulfobacterota bacterium]|jgi:DNA polymerase III subunit beta|nr:DNA polymerase III subunit beta [Thermodesulfobacteriota bacterium]
MKCTISKSVLQNMLGKVQGFTERKSTLPILSHVLMETSGDSLSIKATDLHTSIQVTSACPVASPGSCAMNAKGFYDIIRELPDEDLLFWTDDHSRAHISLGNKNVKMNIMDPEEFPSIDLTQPTGGFAIPVEVMKPLIERTIFSIPTSSESDTKYSLGGALLVVREDKPKSTYIEMVTTDSRRLSIARYKVEGKADTGEGIIVPRKGLQEIKRLMESKEEGARIVLNRDSLYYVSSETTATVRLFDGKFPDYRSIVASETYPIVTRINAQELLGVLKVCVAMVSELASCVRLSFMKDKTVVYANNPEQGEVDTAITSDHTGEEVEISFNPRYFVDCLNFIEGEAEILLKGPQGPCLVMDGAHEECKWIIMPMRF